MTMTLSKAMELELDFLEVIGGGPRAECEAKRRYAMEIEPPNVIVEVGVLRGQGTCCLGCGSRYGHGVPVIGIDLFGLRKSGMGPTYDDPRNERVSRVLADHLGLKDLVTLLRSESVEAAADFTQLIGLLGIDAGHKYEEVLADAKAWIPHVVPGGLLLMHDARSPAWPGVDRVIEEEIRASGEWEELEFVPPFSAWFRRAA